MNPPPIARKPPQRATTLNSIRLPLPATRKRIWEHACDLVATGQLADVSATLAKRFLLPERTIHACLVIEGMLHERVAAVLRNGVISSLEMARRAPADAEQEFSEAS